MSETQEEIIHKVQTKDGPICGLIEKVDNKTYYKFKKIPYALPPVGPLRFMPPVPVKPWKEELDCTVEPSPPASFLFDEVIGSEDCLYIEVCAPKNTTGKLLPVMFWIGSFNFVFNIDPLLDPRVLVDKGVIFVRNGFRMGPFGFLSTNDFVAPGNNGLKDIIIALQWVQRNIECFGGDPNNVTLFGASSGGSIVHYMMLSPMATGLFHKAIIQSACAMNNWALDKNPKQAVLRLAKQLNISSSDSSEVVSILKTLPHEEIMSACYELQSHVEFEELMLYGLFKPCIEDELEGIPVFLPKSPTLILKSGMVNKVPFIIGAYNSEACVLEYLKKKLYIKTDIKSGISVLKAMGENVFLNKMGQKILNFYYDSQDSIAEENKQENIQIMSDYYFLYNMINTIKKHKEIAPESPIYFYINNFAGGWAVPKYLNFFNQLGHSADIPFIFNVRSKEGDVCKGNRDSMLMRSKISQMWTNFAKFSNPTPDEDDPLLNITWDPVTSKDELNYLSISPNFTKGVNPFQDRMAFWDEIHKEHQFLQVLTHFNDSGIVW
ncbi:Venom carboxylesterase-6 [Papilio machaon]|uniref:Carboxylic ester hydrolase n=1 Tax=Papilio machaon TaxID=76193 RepID=A0A194RQB9_PAPMA|nr:Venom carboxylesterase-6 [Papilio machaon]